MKTFNLKTMLAAVALTLSVAAEASVTITAIPVSASLRNRRTS